MSATGVDVFDKTLQTTNIRLDEFLAKIKADLEFVRPVDSGDAFRVVCRVLAHHVDPGQMAKIFEALPEEIRRVAQSRQNA